MNFIQFSFWTRKVHRFFALLTALLGIIMALTGMAMKSPALSLIDPVFARLVHNTVSTYFGSIFFIMMATGLTLFIQPWILKRLKKSQPHAKNTQTSDVS